MKGFVSLFCLFTWDKYLILQNRGLRVRKIVVCRFGQVKKNITFSRIGDSKSLEKVLLINQMTSFLLLDKYKVRTSKGDDVKKEYKMAFKKDDVIIIEPKEMFVGKKDAPVTLVEFGEYESEECAKANEVVKQLLEEYDGKMRFQFFH